MVAQDCGKVFRRLRTVRLVFEGRTTKSSRFPPIRPREGRTKMMKKTSLLAIAVLLGAGLTSACAAETEISASVRLALSLWIAELMR